MRAGAFLTILLSVFSALAPQAFAYEAEGQIGYLDPSLTSTPLHFHRDPLTNDGSRLVKFQAALSAIGVPLEAAPDFSEFPQANTVPLDQVNAHLPFIDPDQGLRRYLDVQNLSFSLYRDFFSSLLPSSFFEYGQTLKQSGESNDSESLIDHLHEVASNSDSQPLRGFKILIDPGHMGSADWDVLTGKYVKVGSTKVSEGQINLWTALLVAAQLEKLGATIKLTRSDLTPVSTEDYRTFDSSTYYNQYFYDSLDQDWVQPFLQLTSTQMVQKFKSAPQTVKAATSAQKTQFFIEGADLEARSRMADDFEPDVTLDIHYDAVRTDAIQTSTNNVSAYVPGSVRDIETGSRKNRALTLKQLFDVRRWNESVNLAASITGEISANTNVPLLNLPEAYTAMRVKPGVYARNLYITRRATNSLMVYLECLHYDYQTEHAALSVNNRQATYRDISFSYPARLDAVAQGIETGIVKYFQNLQ